MKTTEEFINQFKDDFEYELYHYFVSNKQWHQIRALTYERVLKKMGMTEEEKNEIVEKARRAFVELQEFPKAQS